MRQSVFSTQFLQGSPWQSFAAVAGLMTVTTLAAVLVMMGKIQDVACVIDKLAKRYRGLLQRALAEHLPVKAVGAGRTPDSEATVLGTDPPTDISISPFLAIASKLVLVTFPVSEIREATRLYGLLDQPRNGDESSVLEAIDMYENNMSSQAALLGGNSSSGTSQHNRSQTALHNGSSSSVASTTQQDMTSLPNRVQFALLECRAERPKAPPRVPPMVRRRAQKVLLIAARVCMLCVWIPLVLLEYLVLLIWGGLRDAGSFFGLISPPSEAAGDGSDGRDPATAVANNNNNRRWEKLRNFFTRPISVLLGGGSRQPLPPHHEGDLQEASQLPEMLDLRGQRPLRLVQMRSVFARAAAARVVQNQESAERQQWEREQQRAYLQSETPSLGFPRPSPGQLSRGGTWSLPPPTHAQTQSTNLGLRQPLASPQRPIATFLPTRARERRRRDLDLEA